MLCFRLSLFPAGTPCITRQSPIPYQWLNPSILTPNTLAKPATRIVFVSASPVGESLLGTDLFLLSERRWRCHCTSQEAELAQRSLPKRKLNYAANYRGGFFPSHLLFVPALEPVSKAHLQLPMHCDAAIASLSEARPRSPPGLTLRAPRGAVLALSVGICEHGNFHLPAAASWARCCSTTGGEASGGAARGGGLLTPCSSGTCSNTPHSQCPTGCQNTPSRLTHTKPNYTHVIYR